MNEIVTYILSQVMTLGGFALTAYIFGKAFAHGVSNQLKDSVPKWIKAYVKETRDYKAIADARAKMDMINNEHI